MISRDRKMVRATRTFLAYEAEHDGTADDKDHENEGANTVLGNGEPANLEKSGSLPRV